MNAIAHATSASGTSGSSSDSSSTSTASSSLGQSAFLNLLVTQLKNQDPSQPTDSGQWLAELAQFSSLEQMTNINTTLTSQGDATQIVSASSLVGKKVTTSASDSSGNAIGGIVSSVSLANGALTATVDGQSVPVGQISSISQAS